jgi:signal transduction histidine kinase
MRASSPRSALLPHKPPFQARTPRADAFFVTAIAIVALLVIALMAAFAEQGQLHARTLQTISVARSVRDETLSITQALVDVEAARRGAQMMRERLNGVEAAKADALAHAAALQRHTAADPQLAAVAARIAALIEQEFALDSARPSGERLARSDALRADLRAAFLDLRTGVNAFNDAARSAEQRTRQVLDYIAIALGLLSLLAAGLAIVSLRRERAAWREARDVAEQARASAIASDLAKTRFLAVASHDMRQPLHALTLYISALERRVEGAEARDIIKKMDRATQSMVGMFSMLLDLARVQAGVVVPKIVDAPLQEVFDRIVAEHPGGEVEAQPTAIAVRTDSLLLERILSNLVANALKHGGGEARISAHVENAQVVLEVADEGPGIALEDQQRVFEEFVRLEGRSEGLGLGLAIVRRIAELLDVGVELESAPGRGARFRLRLPLARAVGAQLQASDSESALRGVPVLAMDDDPLAREALAGALADLGAQVRACADGEEAAAALAQGFAPKLLLMDLRVDGALRGIDIANAIRARLSPPPNVIIVTGDTGPEALAALRASGHNWLIKPVNPRDLSAAAAAALAVAPSAT